MSKHSDISKILEAELPHLRFCRFRPNKILQPYIQCYWSVNTSLTTGQTYTEFQYPDGGSSLNFHFNQNEIHRSELQLTHSVKTVQFSGKVNSMGIRFRPGGAFKLLGLPISELEPTDYSARDIHIDSFQHIEDRLNTKKQTLSRIKEIELWLLEQYIKTHTKPDLIQALLPVLTNKQTMLTDWLNRHGINRRKLERTFQTEIGLAPNKLIQLNRINTARQIIKSDLQLPLAIVAQRCGFYDQAHFTHHFHRLTAQTPASYQKKKLSQIYN